MSKYEEEKGTLVLPTSAILPLRRALIDALNKDRTDALDLATRTHAHLKSDAGKSDRLALAKALKGTNDWVVSDILDKVIARFDTQRIGRREGGDGYDQVRQLILPRPVYAKPGEKPKVRKLQAPKKKDLPLLPAQTWEFSNDDCYVGINQEKRTVKWSVSRNNHAVERAWETTLGKAFYQALCKVKWTRATGGVFNHTDEYAEDAGMDHGYNPIRISSAFGPLGEQEKESRTGYSPKRRSISRR